MLLEDPGVRKNLYAAACDEIADRFSSFYESFSVVMGAQLLISAINTLLTSIFVFVVDLPYGWIVVVATFLCGLLPIIGNLISNTIIVGIGFTVSAKMAIVALIFLVVLHKLEYFLNSKIIGDRIKNPVWLTLLGLVLGERLMGIPGMILAPVVLYWLKRETSRLPAEAERIEIPRGRDAAVGE
jgi:predicted PurR-regulated permease PerM